MYIKIATYVFRIKYRFISVNQIYKLSFGIESIIVAFSALLQFFQLSYLGLMLLLFWYNIKVSLVATFHWSIWGAHIIIRRVVGEFSACQNRKTSARQKCANGQHSPFVVHFLKYLSKMCLCSAVLSFARGFNLAGLLADAEKSSGGGKSKLECASSRRLRWTGVTTGCTFSLSLCASSHSACSSLIEYVHTAASSCIQLKLSSSLLRVLPSSKIFSSKSRICLPFSSRSYCNRFSFSSLFSS